MFSDRDRTCRANHGNAETPADEFEMVSDRITESSSLYRPANRVELPLRQATAGIVTAFINF